MIEEGADDGKEILSPNLVKVAVMSIHTTVHSPGVYVPSELGLLQALMEDMRWESWYPANPAMQLRFAAFLLKTYERGIVAPDQLRNYCRIAARMRYFAEDETSALELQRFSSRLPGTRSSASR